VLFGEVSSPKRIDCRRVFDFERIASFDFAAAGLCMQLIAFVNLKSKEGLLLRTFFRVEGSRCLLLSNISYVYVCIIGCRGINPDQEKRQPYAFTIICRAAPRYASVIKSRRCV
jgi:hypothetical protein